jgi:hypothetical protein
MWKQIKALYGHWRGFIQKDEPVVLESTPYGRFSSQTNIAEWDAQAIIEKVSVKYTRVRQRDEDIEVLKIWTKEYKQVFVEGILDKVLHNKSWITLSRDVPVTEVRSKGGKTAKFDRTRAPVVRVLIESVPPLSDVEKWFQKSAEQWDTKVIERVQI